MLIYCICTQYLVGAPFVLITASIRRGMEVISLWHCWGGMEAQVSLTVAFSSSAFFSLLFLIFLLTILHIFSMGFRSGEFASCLPCHSNSTAWFHHPARFFYNYPIKFSQKSRWNFRWPADFQRPHCKNCLILPVCTSQHQKDQALHYSACSSTSCPGPCHF